MLLLLFGCDTTQDAEAVALAWHTERVDCSWDYPVWTAPYEDVLVLSAVQTVVDSQRDDAVYQYPLDLVWSPGGETTPCGPTSDTIYVDITWAGLDE